METQNVSNIHLPQSGVYPQSTLQWKPASVFLCRKRTVTETHQWWSLGIREDPKSRRSSCPQTAMGQWLISLSDTLISNGRYHVGAKNYCIFLYFSFFVHFDCAVTFREEWKCSPFNYNWVSQLHKTILNGFDGVKKNKQEKLFLIGIPNDSGVVDVTSN